jgi:hypothetical protein
MMPQRPIYQEKKTATNFAERMKREYLQRDSSPREGGFGGALLQPREESWRSSRLKSGARAA